MKAKGTLTHEEMRKQIAAHRARVGLPALVRDESRSSQLSYGPIHKIQARRRR